MHKTSEINFQNAKQLRKTPTEAENILWNFLRGRKFLNLKFRRQHPVQNYILDFYCHEKKFAVEVDGGHHFTKEQIQIDEERTKVLKEIGIKLLRLTNEEVLDIHAALKKIQLFIGGIKVPSPLGEG